MSDEYNPADPLQGASQCPHGNHFAAVRSDDELRSVCKVCGAPRIQLEPPDGTELSLSGKERAPLVRAQTARAKRFGWRSATAFGAAGGAIGLGVTALATAIFGFGMWVTALPLALTAPLLAIAAIAFVRNGSLTKEIQASIDEAWRLAARDVVSRWGKAITAPQLAEVMGLSEQGAEKVLAELAVDDYLRSDITSDGALSFTPAMRIDTAAAGSTAIDDDLEARFEALAAQEAEEAAASPRAEATFDKKG